MKEIVFLSILSLVSFTVAYADSVDCSNADQSLSYSSFQSSGGAPMQRTTLKYNGLTQSRINSDGEAIVIGFSKEQVISAAESRSDGDTVMMTYTLATGVVQSEGQSDAFSEWVICKKVASSACQAPDGQPCP